jgi:hypothetical protein
MYFPELSCIYLLAGFAYFGNENTNGCVINFINVMQSAIHFKQMQPKSVTGQRQPESKKVE